MRLILSLALAASLSACAPTVTAPVPPGHAPVTVEPSVAVQVAAEKLERLTTLYAQARAFADPLILRFVPEPRASSILAMGDRVAVWLDRARMAATVAGRVAALREAERELSAFRIAAGA